jgi:hypothetical protein
MNYEDRFVPIEDNEDLYVDFDTKGNNFINNLKLTNKRFHKINKKVNTKTGKKTINVEFYSSGAIGNFITDAISGSKQKGYIVGSQYEDLFFKVSICNNKLSNEHITLFYSSPEEYERHQYVNISDNVKTKWREKYMKMDIKLKLQE